MSFCCLLEILCLLLLSSGTWKNRQESVGRFPSFRIDGYLAQAKCSVGVQAHNGRRTNRTPGIGHQNAESDTRSRSLRNWNRSPVARDRSPTRIGHQLVADSELSPPTRIGHRGRREPVEARNPLESPKQSPNKPRSSEALNQTRRNSEEVHLNQPQTNLIKKPKPRPRKP